MHFSSLPSTFSYGRCPARPCLPSLLTAAAPLFHSCPSSLRLLSRSLFSPLLSIFAQDTCFFPSFLFAPFSRPCLPSPAGTAGARHGLYNLTLSRRREPTAYESLAHPYLGHPSTHSPTILYSHIKHGKETGKIPTCAPLHPMQQSSGHRQGRRSAQLHRLLAKPLPTMPLRHIQCCLGLVDRMGGASRGKSPLSEWSHRLRALLRRPCSIRAVRYAAPVASAGIRPTDGILRRA